jgi:hypothetical protein
MMQWGKAQGSNMMFIQANSTMNAVCSASARRFLFILRTQERVVRFAGKEHLRPESGMRAAHRTVSPWWLDL